jgi:hypothetical protein
MRSFLLSGLFFLGFLSFSYGQSTTATVTATSKEELALSKENGIYTFHFPEGTTAESINDVSKYYVQFFSVTFEEDKALATIKMVTNDAASRRIITRFFKASNIDNVAVEDVLYDTNEFYTSFLAE